ncbi:hypothetical protein TNCV_4097051 [Trichonephila clavipes]|nr:hypothetical protein TNCV_4097051 [Trichonephila clavipes]
MWSGLHLMPSGQTLVLDQASFGLTWHWFKVPDLLPVVAVSATPFAVIVKNLFCPAVSSTPSFKGHRRFYFLVLEMRLPPQPLSSVFEEGKN